MRPGTSIDPYCGSALSSIQRVKDGDEIVQQRAIPVQEQRAIGVVRVQFQRDKNEAGVRFGRFLADDLIF
jgi:hypothetical protein